MCEFKLELWSLTFDLWPWPFAWTSRLSMVITPESVRLIRWQEHCQKGVTDGRTDGQTDRQTTDRQTETDRQTDTRTDGRKEVFLRAAWSQLKTLLWSGKLDFILQFPFMYTPSIFGASFMQIMLKMPTIYIHYHYHCHHHHLYYIHLLHSLEWGKIYLYKVDLLINIKYSKITVCRFNVLIVIA